MSETILYGYWRSSATYRTRIALNLKGVSYRTVGVHLLKDEHTQPRISRAIPPAACRSSRSTATASASRWR